MSDMLFRQQCFLETMHIGLTSTSGAGTHVRKPQLTPVRKSPCTILFRFKMLVDWYRISCLIDGIRFIGKCHSILLVSQTSLGFTSYIHTSTALLGLAVPASLGALVSVGSVVSPCWPAAPLPAAVPVPDARKPFPERFLDVVAG